MSNSINNRHNLHAKCSPYTVEKQESFLFDFKKSLCFPNCQSKNKNYLFKLHGCQNILEGHHIILLNFIQRHQKKNV